MNIIKSAFIVMLIGSAVIDPSGYISIIREISIFFALVFVCLYFLKGRLLLDGSGRRLILFSALVFFCSIMAVFVGYIAGSVFERLSGSEYIAFSLCLLAFLIFYTADANLVWRISVFWLRFLSLVIWFVGLAYFFKPNILFDFAFLGHGSFLYIGSREYGGIGFPYIYWITSPLLVFLIANDSYKLVHYGGVSNFLLLLFSAGALFLAGTRACMFVAIALPLLCLIRRLGVVFFLIVVLLGSLVVMLKVDSFNFVGDMLSLGEASNDKKIGYLEIYQLIFDQWNVLIYGQGFNAVENSSLARSLIGLEASRTELTYLEILRVFGWVFGSLMLAFLIAPLVREIKGSERHVYIVRYGWLFYFLISATNPYIFSLNGAFAYALCCRIASGGQFGPSKISLFCSTRVSEVT